MPGAGSARAAGFISTIAPKDGTVIAAIMPGAVMGPLLDEKAEALFDPTKVQLSRHRQQRHARLRVAQGFQDQDLRRRAHAEGRVRRRLGQRFHPRIRLHAQATPPGAQYDVVSGYSGTAEIALAMERGEIDGACGWDWSSFKSQRPDWLRDGKVNVLLQVGLEPQCGAHPHGRPSVFKYVKSDEARKVVELVISQQVFQRSYIAPPGIPAEQLDDAAHRLRCHHERPAVPRRRREDSHRRLAAVRRARCRSWCRSSTQRRRISSRGRGKPLRHRSTARVARTEAPGVRPGLLSLWHQVSRPDGCRAASRGGRSGPDRSRHSDHSRTRRCWEPRNAADHPYAHRIRPYCASPGWTCPRREAVCASAGVATTAASATAATNDFMIVLRFIEIAPLIAHATFETHSRNRQCTMF